MATVGTISFQLIVEQQVLPLLIDDLPLTSAGSFE